jgi:hypothetical protein
MQRRDIARQRGLLAQLAIELVVTDEEVVRRLLARGQGGQTTPTA